MKVNNNDKVISKGRKKKVSSIKKKSLLDYHNEKIESYKEDSVKKRIKKLEGQLEMKRKLLNELNKNRGTKVYPMIIDNSIHNIKKESNNESWVDIRVFNVRNEITELEKDIKEIKNPDNLVNYLLDSSYILKKYIELDKEENLLLTNITIKNTENINDIIKKKNDITTDYISIFYPNEKQFKILYNEINICKNCNVQYNNNVCEQCGRCSGGLEIAEEMSYKESQEYNRKPQFTYEKASHLADWLRRFTSSEGKIIPQEILDKVILEAHKERVTDLSKLYESQVKRYLKKLNLNEYYENVISIINRINKRPPFILPIEVEEKIKIMFTQIQDPFKKYKPKTRKNFLSYSYCLYQFFKILGLPEFSKYFTLLKSYDKLHQQDEIFKKIVAEMAVKDKTIDWKFFPTT